jgi:hypothetical protein
MRRRAVKRRAVVGVLGALAIAVRVAQARDRRILHPDGRSFTGSLQVWGTGEQPTGSRLLDDAARHPVTVRISKGAGTPAGLPDVLGLAVRVHGSRPGERRDLLLSTAGTTRVSRHLPVPRWGFDTFYGSILAYRTAGAPDRRVYLGAVVDPDATALGRTLDAVVAAATGPGASMLLTADGRPFGRLSFGAALPAVTDAALAFDPVRNTDADLHPTGMIHASRAWAYRAGQRWRGVRPARPDTAAVIRTTAHR